MANILYAYVNKTLIAETEYEFYLCFDSLLENYDRYMILCHLYDSQFFLEYYLPEIWLSPLAIEDNVKPSFLLDSNSISTMRKKIRTFKMKFPSHLAGGTFRLDFVLQKMQANTLEVPKIYENTNPFQKNIINAIWPQPLVPFGIPVQNNSFSFDVTIEHPSGPSFKNLYWGTNEDIRYGVTSPTRSETTVYANEQLYAHIHTEGMYGKTIKTDIGDYTGHPVTIKDNTLVVNFPANIFYNTSKKNFLFRPYIDSSKPCGKTITPNLTYNTGNALNIGAPMTSAANVMTGAKTEDWEKCSDSFCRVDFRPTDEYDGSFGFSWFRVEDTEDYNVLNDWTFLDNLGYHYETYQPGVSEIVHQDPNDGYEGEFHKNEDMIKRHINEYQRIIMPLMLDGDDMDSPESVLSGKYLVPQMTIRKGETAELAMYIKSKSMPEKFSIEFSNPAAEKEGYLTIDKKDWNSIKTGDKLKIECKKEFSKVINLDIYAYPQKDDETRRDLCGSIRILPNDIMHQRNVDLLMINVIYNGLNAKDITKIEGKNIQKIYNQVYLNINVVNKDINLSDPNDLCVKKYFQDKKKWPIEVFNGLLTPSKKVHYSKDNNSILQNLFMDLITHIPSLNKNCFKIILIPLYSDQVNGFSRGNRFTVCFSGCNESTPVHELGHAFGLPHTFTGCTSRAKYVYKYTTTDNIMDYSHHIHIDRHSFFNWQWKTMNALME